MKDTSVPYTIFRDAAPMTPSCSAHNLHLSGCTAFQPTFLCININARAAHTSSIHSRLTAGSFI